MKKILFPLLAFFMLVSLTGTYAQRNNGRFGIKGGVTFNKFVERAVLFSNSFNKDNYKFGLGYHIGVFYTIESRDFRVQPGLRLVQRRSKIRIEDFDSRLKYSYSRQKMNYLQFPVELSVKVVDFGNSGGLLLYMEPHVEYCFSATQEIDSKTEHLNIGTDDDRDSVYPFDCGIGVGFSFDLGVVEYAFGDARI